MPPDRPSTRGAVRPWFRRRPPADLDPFRRRAWWVGHGQVFVAVGVLAAGLIAFLVAAAARPGWLYFGVLLVAMAGPFVLSGTLLRGYNTELAGPSTSLARRIVELCVVVMLIAVLAVICVCVVAVVLICVIQPLW